MHKFNFLASEGENQTRVEVISKRVLAVNITATDWEKPILERIGYLLPGGPLSSSSPLNGNSIDGFNEYLKRPQPKAFALADGGHWAAVWKRTSKPESDLASEAVQNCKNRGYTNCKVYAINSDIVWSR